MIFLRTIAFLMIIFSGFISYAKIPDIVAIVNNIPITRYDLESYEHVMDLFRKQDDEAKSAKHAKSLQSLIEQELLIQYFSKIGGKISDKDIDYAIHSMEQQNDVADGYFLELVGEHKNAFKKQVKMQLILDDISRQFAGAKKISDQEVKFVKDNFDNKQNFDVDFLIISSKDTSKASLSYMQKYKKQLSTCENLPKDISKHLTVNRVTTSWSKLDRVLQLNIQNTEKVGNINKHDNSFQLILMCKQVDKIKSEDVEKIKYSLVRSKVSHEITKLISDFRARSHIKIMLNK